MTIGPHPIIFRNSPFMIFFYWFFGIAALFISVGLALVALSVCITPSHNIFLKILGAVQWGFGGFAMASLGWNMCRIGMQTPHYQAQLDSQGVNFRLGTKKEPRAIFFPWDNIAAVKHKRLPMSQYYAVEGKDNRLVDFTNLTFFRPKKLATLIATHVGQTVQEMGR